MRPSVAVGLLLALLLSGCQAGGLEKTSAPDGVVVGGEATIALTRPASLDPGNVLDRTGEVVVRAMCDPLLDVDRESGEYVSALLDSWVVTDAGTRLVLRLKQGLTFWDGTPVTARDAIFSLSRAASADFAGANAFMLFGIGGAAILGGFEEAEEPRHRLEFAGIRLISELAFEINLDFTAPTVLPALTHPTASVLSKRAAEADPEGFEAMPVCVGPYRPQAPFDPSASTFVLERVVGYPGVNDAYSGGGQGWLDRLTFEWFEPRSPAASDAAQPTFVGASDHPGFDAADIVEVSTGQRRAALREGATVLAVDAPVMQYLGLPSSTFPTQARLAFSQALDRRFLAEVILGGRATPATSFFHPSVGSRLYRADACDGVLNASADVDAARRTLEASGLDVGGLTIELVSNPDFDNAAIIGAVASQLETAFPGLTVRPVLEPWEAYRLRFDDPSGVAQPFRYSHGVPMASPDFWLRPFTSREIGDFNPAAYTNVDFDELVDFDAAEAIDPVDQAFVHRDAEQILCRDLPLIPLVSDLRHYALDDGLASATGDVADLADPITGGLRLRELYRP